MIKQRLMLLITLLALTSCSAKGTLKSIQTDNMDYSNGFNIHPITYGNNGVYYLHSNEDALYFYNQENKVNTKLTETRFVDDNPAPKNDADFKNYRENMSDHEIVFYDDHLYAIFTRVSIDGSFSYSLKRLNKKGEALENLIDFNDFPLRFKIDSGKIYVLFGDTEYYMEVYDSKFKLTETLEFKDAENPYEFYFYKGELMIPENDYVVVSHENLKIEYTIINGPGGPGSSAEKTEVNSSIRINGDVHNFEGKLVIFASDNYFYVTSLEGKQVYEKFDFNGNLVSFVAPSDYLETDSDISTLFWHSDFSIPLRVINDQYVYGEGLLGEETQLFVCDFDALECRYLNE